LQAFGFFGGDFRFRRFFGVALAGQPGGVVVEVAVEFVTALPSATSSSSSAQVRSRWRSCETKTMPPS
jgi:hypothetical protein